MIASHSASAAPSCQPGMAGPLAHHLPCPRYPEEIAERYVMRWMSAGESQAFEAHLSHCPDCVQVVSEIQMFAGILRAALSEAVGR